MYRRYNCDYKTVLLIRVLYIKKIIPITSSLPPDHVCLYLLYYNLTYSPN